MQQQALMKFDPATGRPKPYPSHAGQWREYHGRLTAWLFNPWTGERRGAGDVGADLTGLLIVLPSEKDFAPIGTGIAIAEQQRQRMVQAAIQGGEISGAHGHYAADICQNRCR